MTVKRDILIKHKKNVFIETGTYKGDTAALCSNLGYQQVYSIELQPHLYKKSALRLAKLIEAGKVTLVCGDSKVELPKILDKISVEAVILLDAHGDFQPKHLSGKYDYSPLYAELRAIANHPIKTHTIIIDDLRIMGVKDTWGANLQKETLIQRVQNINPRYIIDFEDGETPKDILVAYCNG